VVLVDHTSEHLPPLDWEVQRRADVVILAGWALLAGLVGPMLIVVVGVLAED
jgi:hypothetical protein